MDHEKVESLLPGSRRFFKEKSPLIYQGEAPRSGFFVKSGIIKSYTLKNNGDEQVTGFLKPGDIFPLSWLYDITSISMYYYETVEECQLISLTRSDIHEVISNNVELLKFFNQKMARDQAAQLMRVTALEQARAVEKIAFTLYFLLLSFGNRKTDDGWYEIDLTLTHSLIASLVGLTRETTAVEINRLKRKKVVTYKNKIYTVNKKNLETAIGEDSFSELIS